MYKTLKIPFTNIVKEKNTKDILEDMILRTNKIIKHTYYFIKLYSIHSFENNIYNIYFDKQNIRYIYSLISTIKSKSIIKYKNNDMEKFYNDVFSKINIKKISRDGLTNILAYEADIIITSIENNIKNNFIRHFNRYINVVFDIKNKINNIKDPINKKLLWADIKTIKYDILSFNKYKSEIKFHNIIKKEQEYLFNNFFNGKNDIKCILYDVKKNSQKYLYTFYKILTKFELLNKTIIDDKMKNKLFNILPLRTSLIPKHITIDSEILIQNFKSTIKMNLSKFPEEIKNIESLRLNFTKYQDILWNIFFNIDKIKINTNYKFDYLLKTDNNACSLQFAIKTEEKKQRFKKGVNKKLNDITKNKNEKAHKNIQYIDDILSKNRFALNDKKVVCIDPNKGDLIYSGIYKNNKLVTFRYTNNQRKKEQKRKKYALITRSISNNTKIKINNKLETITKIETEKTKYKKTEINKNKIMLNIIETEKIDNIINEHYETTIFRKLNMNNYINTQRSESRMINNFKEKIGSEKDTVVIIGDNGLKDVVVKGLESTISKSIIEIFKRNHYETYIIDEFRTSKLCNSCENPLSKWLDVKSKKPNSNGKLYKSNGILRCQSSTQLCNVIHNRDKNAVKNMLKIVLNYQITGKRLLKYSRKFSL